jgi:hypothetical protein
MKNATPGPWERGKGADAEYIIAKGGEWPDKRIAEIYYECGRRGSTTREERSANADLIVTAVNAHETLVIACTFAAEELNRIIENGFDPERWGARIRASNAIEQALRLARAMHEPRR